MRTVFVVLFFPLLVCSSIVARAQGVHFSQYYNAPFLLNPANTALMPDDDYRAGALYRNQWSQIPVSYHTIAAYADFKVLKDNYNNNWLGIGGAFYNDRAGAGDLSLTQLQLTAAYHLQLGNFNMLSVGLGMAYAQRSVNFAKFTFDNQWDGFTFNTQLPNGENHTFQKTAYADISGGINYAYFPNENVYLKVGLGVAHINQPTESFYQAANKIGIRPQGNVDLLFRLNEQWITEISGYYTQQKSASELVYGFQASYNVTPEERTPNVLLLGIYHRFNDALIPVVGFQWNNIITMASVDITVSALGRATSGNGAFELSFIYQGVYGGRTPSRGGYNCPRF